MITRRILVAAALMAAALAPKPADAASQMMCSSRPASGSLQRTVTNPNTSNVYILNGQGCAVMRNDDATWAVSQGFTPAPGVQNLLFTQQTTGFSFVVPLSAYIKDIILHEGSGNAVSSGICVGTTNGGSDIATSVGTASLLKPIADSSMAKRILSTTAATTAFLGSCTATGFGSSNWDVTVVLGYF